MSNQNLPDGSISFDPQAYSLLGAGVVVLYRDHVALVQVNYGQFKGAWILPGGQTAPEEAPAAAAVRETLEETGLEIEVRDLLAVRHRVLGPERQAARADVYFVFRGEVKEAQSSGWNPAAPPKLQWPDEELLEARFWKISEALQSEAIRPITRQAIRMAIKASEKDCAFQRLPLPSGYAFKDEFFGLS